MASTQHAAWKPLRLRPVSPAAQAIDNESRGMADWAQPAGAPAPLISYEFTLRDGEKLSEQLTYDYEFLEEAGVPHVHKICANSVFDPDEFADNLHQLMDLVVNRRRPGLVQAMSRIVPEFAPSPTLLNYVR